MNNSNPLIPQGSLLEQQQNKGRRHFKIAILCVLAVNGLILGVMLIVGGCKPEAAAPTDNTPPAQSADTTPPTPDTNVVSTNIPAPPSTNVVAAPPIQPTPPPAPPVPAAPSEYVVVHGDSFYTIAKKLGVPMKALEAANSGVEPTKLKVGQKLQVPDGAGQSATAAPLGTSSDEGEVYVVKAGDNLTKIAHQHGTTIKALEVANNLTSANKIKVGQKLKIPARNPAPAMDSTPVPAPAPAPVAPPVTTPAPAPAPAAAPGQ